MAGEDRVTDFELDAMQSEAIDWKQHTQACHGYGTNQLSATVVDPAAVPGAVPREMHLVKGLLRAHEVDNLRMQFDALGSASAAEDSHARVIVEDGRVMCDELHALLAPALHNRILPYVRERLGESRVVVADALMRAYRQEDRRQALAPHFDLSSYATVIIPLNPGEYSGGLYVQSGAAASSRVLVDPSFDKGDALMHRFDVMHGVDVFAGSRYSLVLWLSDCRESVHARTAPWLRESAVTGNPYAQFLYGECCRSGTYGVVRDEAAALAYQQDAASRGHALSQYQLGMLYWGGSGGVEKSEARCLEMWHAAASAGLATSQVKMGMAHQSGYLGLSRDEDAAREWFERAARQGHTEAAAVLRRGPPYEL